MKIKYKTLKVIQNHSEYRLLFIFAFTATLSGQADAAILRTLDSSKTIEVPIAQEGLTRITVEGDRIHNVFGLADQYVLEADEDQGQVFIRPVDPALGSINLTITTEKGHTQDLRFLPKNQTPEALVLQEEQDKKESAGSPRKLSKALSPTVRDTITRDEVETLLHACEENRIPLGYKSVSLTLPTLKGPYLLVRELKAQTLRGLTYKVANSSNKPLHLSEETFARSIGASLPPIVAILMPHKPLNPKETAYVYVVTAAD